MHYNGIQQIIISKFRAFYKHYAIICCLKEGIVINCKIRVAYLENEPGVGPEYTYTENIEKAKAAAFDIIAEHCALFPQNAFIQIKPNRILSIEILNEKIGEWEAYGG